MSWLIALKFFHYLSLFLAGGAGVANGMLAAAHARAGTPPAAPVQMVVRRLARLGLIALILIWITGLGLYHALYQSLDLEWAFVMKLIGASLLLGASIYMNLLLSRAAKTGTPPNPKLAKAMQSISRGALVLVLLGIAIVTS